MNKNQDREFSRDIYTPGFVDKFVNSTLEHISPNATVEICDYIQNDGEPLVWVHVDFKGKRIFQRSFFGRDCDEKAMKLVERLRRQGHTFEIVDLQGGVYEL